MCLCVCVVSVRYLLVFVCEFLCVCLCVCVCLWLCLCVTTQKLRKIRLDAENMSVIALHLILLALSRIFIQLFLQFTAMKYG